MAASVPCRRTSPTKCHTQLTLGAGSGVVQIHLAMIHAFSSYGSTHPLVIQMQPQSCLFFLALTGLGSCLCRSSAKVLPISCFSAIRQSVNIPHSSFCGDLVTQPDMQHCLVPRHSLAQGLDCIYFQGLCLF